MATSPPRSSTPPTVPDDDETAEETGLQLPLSASLVLTSLPKDAATALREADENDGVPAKVTIRLLPVASAPTLKQRVFKVSSSNRFETIVSFLSKKLTAMNEGKVVNVFCYVNSVFAPGLDEGVGGLWRCFKTDDQLIVSYSTTPAFG